MVHLAGRASPGTQAATGLVARRELRIDGTVQGVGFRPHVYSLALRWGLAGWVLNSEQGVRIEVEGPPEAVYAFERSLWESPPPLAVITRFDSRPLDVLGDRGFRIVASQKGEARQTSIPADAALCSDCRREVLDPANRRYRYPFTNCTNCGPRFTIVRDIPYDRPMTTMAHFPMCPACAGEYQDPLDRRFHAQPNACPECGPQVTLLDRGGGTIPGDWLTVAAEALRAGQILAVKGLGGYHLACDVANPGAVALLRVRKRRPHRPFALMARDLDTVRQLCHVSEEEARLLQSPSALIVLLEQRSPGSVAPDAAPGLTHLGMMLPYTPLHLLLLTEGPPVLVMTSGNPSGLPLAIENQEALERLGHLADLFLTHNRPIFTPCDDSVTQVVDGEVLLYRRSRGYVPRPVLVEATGDAPPVLGMGGDLKNAFCLLSGERAVFSQHLGDLETEEGRQNFRRALDHLTRLSGITPGIIAHDMHPGYWSTALAQELPAAVRVAVQHHHAHLAACMAEHRVEGEAIGLILDGTGYGLDGSIWGFEILAGDARDCRRLLHLASSPLPGGEGAIRQPLMAAAGLVGQHLGEPGMARMAALLGGGAPAEFVAARALLQAHLNCPPAGTAGRLFDGVSALLNICRRQTYEGQAAIELGAVAEPAGELPYPVGVAGDRLLPAPLLEGILTDLEAGLPRERIAGRFLQTVLAMLLTGAHRAREATGLQQVCLGGGTFQSAWLLSQTVARLTADGFTVFRPRSIAPGDGGLALGQAIIARRRWQERCV